ncbi:L-ribulose-5-phosphate 4-epimerase [Wansuia hejianensis]|uniref:L-ribulose-5-phosphate 4-epimerase n=1 Tax=Wansuia hejianensis TaxID=2763667 RepID=UPI0024B5EF80|nr:L-ribulose-5-phosphate 4-epimerase [Wansuia hejianensis]
MLERLKTKVYEANMELPFRGLVTYTWGNVSGFDRESGYMVIKPSGVKYEDLDPENLVVMDLKGNVVEGRLKPSSDTATHLELYRAFPEIGGIVHTHSVWATSWAQACRELPLYGTTQADYFYESVGCTRQLTDEEIAGDYEKNTGLVIVETLLARKIPPLHNPAVLVAGHGPFVWGSNAEEAVHNAVVLEETAKMALLTEQLSQSAKPLKAAIRDRHFYRKHGTNAYYGQ